MKQLQGISETTLGGEMTIRDGRCDVSQMVLRPIKALQEGVETEKFKK